ncbi:MAG: DegV family protein [Oscillospiraceae bacterium]|nr:DegV family protein [Oscillospiraceae bacterium]
MGIRIISDSTSYISNDIAKELNILIIPLSVHFPDESYDEDKVDYEYFYEKIRRDNVIPTSSQPSPWELETIFREVLEAGDDIIAIFLSSAMSGTYHHALSAKAELTADFPDRQIEIIDSYTNCMALGYIVLEAVKSATNGSSFSQVVDAAISARSKIHFYFTPKTLNFLKKGGRIGTASALLGRIFDINTILTVDMTKGMTHLYGKTRGLDSAISKIYKVLSQDSEKYGLEGIYIGHINSEEKALEMKKQLMVMYPDVNIELCSIGPVIGLHVGPGTVGLIYSTKEVKYELPDSL